MNTLIQTQMDEELRLWSHNFFGREQRSNVILLTQEERHQAPTPEILHGVLGCDESTARHLVEDWRRYGSIPCFRGDEESTLTVARRLERHGIHVEVRGC